MPINLFEFFQNIGREVAIEMGVGTITPIIEAQLDQHLGSLQSAYFGRAAVNYTPERRLAYLFHFAPKHAVAWRYLAQRYKFSFEDEAPINILGCGPCCELIGMIEGSGVKAGTQFVVAAHDCEPGWQPIVDKVLNRYCEQTNTDIQWEFVLDTTQLIPEAQVLGSFILSDMGRSGQLNQMQRLVPPAIRPAKGQFIDFPNFTAPSGNSVLLSNELNCGWSSLKYRGDNPADDIRAEMDGYQDCICRRTIPATFNLNAFFIDFK